MQTRPCRLITTPAEHTLQRYRAHTILLADQQPHRPKPHSQWRSRILKHRARSHRNLIRAASALNTARLQRPALARFTSRATESVRPPETEQVLPASLLGTETPLKLQKCSRIILFHDPELYRLGQPESNGYQVLLHSRSRERGAQIRRFGWCRRREDVGWRLARIKTELLIGSGMCDFFA